MAHTHRIEVRRARGKEGGTREIGRWRFRCRTAGGSARRNFRSPHGCGRGRSNNCGGHRHRRKGTRAKRARQRHVQVRAWAERLRRRCAGGWEGRQMNRNCSTVATGPVSRHMPGNPGRSGVAGGQRLVDGGGCQERARSTSPFSAAGASGGCLPDGTIGTASTTTATRAVAPSWY